MSQWCSVCKEELPNDGAFTLCSVNACCLHFQCAGITEKSWKSMSNPNKTKWKCPACRKTDNTEDNPVSAEELRKFMTSVTTKLSGLTTTVSTVEASIKLMSSKYDEVLKTMGRHDKEIKQQSKAIQNLEKESKENNAEVKALQEKINEMEQYSRNRNIEISGIPETETENLYQIINKLAQKININSGADDIDVVHRIPSKKRDVPPRIIVQFKTRQARDLWVNTKKRGLLSSDAIGGNGPPLPVYISEHLTPQMKQLLWKTKQVARESGYTMVWCKNSKILVKKNIGDPNIIRIYNENDILKLQSH